MASAESSLSISHCTPVHEVWDNSHTVWKNAGKPLEIEVVSVSAGKAAPIAKIRLLPGALKQPARTKWLKRMGRRIEARTEDPVEHWLPVATVISLKIAKGASYTSAVEVLEFVAHQLPSLWNLRYKQELFFVEFRPDRIGVKPGDLGPSWRLLDPEGSELQRGGIRSEVTAPIALAFKSMVEGLEMRLPLRSRKNTPLKRLPMNDDLVERCTPAMLEELVKMLGWVKDPRRKATDDYPAVSVVAIICFARRAESKSARQIARFATLFSDAQRSALGLTKVRKHGENKESRCVPSHDMFSDFMRVGRVISGRKVTKSFNEWLKGQQMEYCAKDFIPWVLSKRKKKAVPSRNPPHDRDPSDSLIFRIHEPGKNGGLYVRSAHKH